MNRALWSAFALALLSVSAAHAEEAAAEKPAAEKPAAPVKAPAAKPAVPAAKPATPAPVAKPAPGTKTAGVPSPAKVPTAVKAPPAAKAPTSASAPTAAKAPVDPALAMPKPPVGPAAPVYCGSFTPIHFRLAALGKTADARALHAMDVINKFLGGSVGKFTTRPDGKNTRLLLNNELLAVITPQDAAVERARSAAELATRWTKVLTVAFNASKAQP